MSSGDGALIECLCHLLFCCCVSLFSESPRRSEYPRRSESHQVVHIYHVHSAGEERARYLLHEAGGERPAPGAAAATQSAAVSVADMALAALSDASELAGTERFFQFGPGPQGVRLRERVGRYTTFVGELSQPTAEGSMPLGAVITRVAGVGVDWVPYVDVIARIKAAERPLVIHFRAPPSAKAP